MSGTKPPPLYDDLGLYVPLNWRFAYETKWLGFSEAQRRHLSEGRLERDYPPEKVRRASRYLPRFSTKAAKVWGKKQGWKLVDEERYDHRLNRHHDIYGCFDLHFEDGDQQIVVQAAGRSERNAHFAKFEKWGGAEKARRRHLQVLYWVFERGNAEPVEVECWA